MIHWTEEQATRSPRQTANCHLNGAQLTAFPILIDDDFVCFERNLRGNSFRIRSKHDAAHTDTGMLCYVEQMFEKRTALIGKQRLWRTHAVRSTAREYYGGEHAASP